MLLEQTFTQLRELRLTGMADALEEQQAVPDVQSLSFEDRLGLLVEREATVRQDRRLARLLRQAKLRLPATIEDLDLRSPRGLDRSVILRLANCDWVRNHQVVLITGATGTGKTYLACALAQAACRQGIASRYLRLTQLIEDMALARADGSYPKLMSRLQKTALLVIDDYGMAPLNQTERRDLLEVIEDRSGRRATLLASQLPLEHWHEVIGDATFADAILDRLVHHAHRISLKGASMRRKEPKNKPSKTVSA